MQAITYATAEAQLADTIERVCVDHEPVIITRDHDQAVVILSLDDYNARPETQRPRDPETQRPRDAEAQRKKEHCSMFPLRFSSPSLLLFFSSSLRLCVFASLREISFSCVVCATWHHLMDIMRRPHPAQPCRRRVPGPPAPWQHGRSRRTDVQDLPFAWFGIRRWRHWQKARPGINPGPCRGGSTPSGPAGEHPLDGSGLGHEGDDPHACPIVHSWGRTAVGRSAVELPVALRLGDDLLDAHPQGAAAGLGPFDLVAFGEPQQCTADRGQDGDGAAGGIDVFRVDQCQ
jgi:prevent-host-death family protein